MCNSPCNLYLYLYLILKKIVFLSTDTFLDGFAPAYLGYLSTSATLESKLNGSLPAERKKIPQ